MDRAARRLMLIEALRVQPFRFLEHVSSQIESQLEQMNV